MQIFLNDEDLKKILQQHINLTTLKHFAARKVTNIVILKDKVAFDLIEQEKTHAD